MHARKRNLNNATPHVRGALRFPHGLRCLLELPLAGSCCRTQGRPRAARTRADGVPRPLVPRPRPALARDTGERTGLLRRRGRLLRPPRYGTMAAARTRTSTESPGEDAELRRGP